MGVFPRNFVTVLEVKEKAVGLHPYTSEDKKYLNFIKGEVINILVRDSSGWWRAQNARGHTGRYQPFIHISKRFTHLCKFSMTGLVPRNYVRILAEGEDPSLVVPTEDTKPATSTLLASSTTITTTAVQPKKDEGDKGKEEAERKKKEEEEQKEMAIRDKKLQDLVKVEDDFKKEFRALKNELLDSLKTKKSVLEQMQEVRQQKLEKVEELEELMEEIEI